MENTMFCYQCQETCGCTGCTKFGACGKSPSLSRLQDLLIYVTKGLSCVTTQLRKEGKEVSDKINTLICDNLFKTITNANFDDDIIKVEIDNTIDAKNILITQLENKDLCEASLWSYSTEEEMNEKAKKCGVLATENEDIRSLRELILYGIKGLAAYLKHANVLGFDNIDIHSFMQSTLAKLLDDSLSVDDLIALTMETGKYGVDVMALLDKANTSTYGNPEITKVNIGVRNNPAILISGHDLKDLELLLQQTEGKGVDVYTHSEMLPSHY